MTLRPDIPSAGGDAARRPLPVAVAAAGLLALCAAKILVAAWLYDRSRVWLHHDDYCRSVMALGWARTPWLYPFDLHWLPLPFYVYGLAAKLGFANQHLVFTAVSQALGLITTIGVYWLTTAMFSRTAGLIAAALYAFAAWAAVLSHSALAEPLYYPLVVFGVGAYVRWWIGLKPRHLLAASICLALAAATRYEAWLLIAMVSGMCAWRLWRAGAGRRPTVVAAALLVIAWSVPLLWMLENLRVAGVPLVFYGANREAFDDALHQLTLTMRIARYPLALLGLSPIITLVLLSALAWAAARPRAWRVPGLGALLLITLGHFTLLTVLYVRGSGPSFVDRIVLTHLILLLPVCGEVLARIGGSRRPGRRLLVPALLVVFAAAGTYRAHDMIVSERFSDYAGLSDKYERLLDVITDELGRPGTHVAVHTSDNALFLKFRAGEWDRIHPVTADTAGETFATYDIGMLCLPSADAGYLKVDDPIEQAWREHCAGAPIVETRHDYWRVLRIGEAASAAGGRR